MLKRIFCLLCISALITGAFPITVFAQNEAENEDVQLEAKLYVFNNNHGYPIDGSKPLSTAPDNCKMGSLVLSGSFSKEEPKDDISSFLVEDNELITSYI